MGQVEGSARSPRPANADLSYLHVFVVGAGVFVAGCGVCQGFGLIVLATTCYWCCTACFVSLHTLKHLAPSLLLLLLLLTEPTWLLLSTSSPCHCHLAVTAHTGLELLQCLPPQLQVVCPCIAPERQQPVVRVGCRQCVLLCICQVKVID